MLVDRVLEELDVDVELFALCEISEGSDLAIGDLGWVTMHFVMAGQGELTIGSEATVKLPRYTLCLVKRSHVLRGTGKNETGRVDLALDGVRRLHGTPRGESDFVVACGRIKATYGLGLDLFDLIEDPVVVDFSGSKQMRELFRSILSESAHPTLGSTGMISAMMRQCLVLLVRELSTSSRSGLVWIDALGDERMGDVMQRVLNHPEDVHTVESLARNAAMSRSSFAALFKESFNQTPMRFVRMVRLGRAAELLRTTRHSTATIARRTGFASRSHFARSFKHKYGVAPGEFRRLHAE
ncbi:MAG: helix-turn-helix domain-containing protein [Actinomycetota bacterium]